MKLASAILPAIPLEGHEDDPEHLIIRAPLRDVLAIAAMRADVAVDEPRPPCASFTTEPYSAPAPAPTQRCAA